MTTPILKIPEVSDGQINQFLVYNAALRLLESASNDFLTVNLAAGSLSLTDAQFNAFFLFYSVGNTVSRSITVPASKRFFSVYNAGSFDLSVIRGSSTQTVSPASFVCFFTDGTANGIFKLGGSGSGLAWFSGSKNTAGPNSSVPVVVIAPDDTPANIDIAIVPKGSGSFMLDVPDGTSAGGNKRGFSSIDLQTARVYASQVASGDVSVALGASSTAGGAYSVAIQGGTASGLRAVSVGSGCVASGNDSFAMGVTCKAPAQSGWALGERSNTFARRGILAWSSGNFSAEGDSQSLHYVLRRQTTDATVSELTADFSFGGTTNQLALPNFSAVTFKGLVVARQNSTGDSKSWEISGLIKRASNAASTVIVGSPAINVLGADSGASLWDVSISADATNGVLKISAAGEAGKTIRWTCVLDCAELIG